LLQCAAHQQQQTACQGKMHQEALLLLLQLLQQASADNNV
jgi:hypothetical protein